MKLTVLTDNHTHIDQYYLGEPALCFLIETDGRKILLDTGYSDVCLRNSQAMGIDLRQVDTIAYFQAQNLQHLYPCHCVSFRAKAEMHRAIPIHEVGVGLQLNW